MRPTRFLAPLLASTLLVPLAACGDLGVVPDGEAPDTQDPEPEPDPMPDPGSARVTAGLQALYTFDEGTGTVVTDTSGVGLPLTLIVEDPASVEWIDGGGIDVLAPTLIASSDPADKLGSACMASNSLTIEAWVRPAAVNQIGPARVVTFSGDNNNRNFTLGQDNTLADIRLRTSDTDPNGQPELQSDIAAFDGNVAHVVYNWSGLDDEAQIWHNGQLVGTQTLAGNLSTWDMTYRLGLANELTGERPWRGEIYLVAVYCRDLTPAEIFQNYQAGY